MATNQTTLENHIRNLTDVKFYATVFEAESHPSHSIIESIKDGLYVADSDGKLLFVNQSMIEIFGYKDKDEMIGLDIAEKLYTKPKDRDTFLRHMRRKGFVCDYEITMKRKSGKDIFASATSNFIRDSRGKIIGAEGVIRDITKRKLAEAKLRQLQHTLKDEKQKLEQVLNIDQKISSILDLNHLVDFVIEKATEILDAEKCSLMLLDADSQELLIRGARGIDGKYIKDARVKIGDQVAGLVGKHGKPMLVEDIELVPAFNRKNRGSYKTKSFICVPIKVHDKLVGVVNVSDKKPRTRQQRVFTEIDLKILSTIVRQAAISIENANHCRSLEYLSTADPLTGIYNHRYFIRALDHEISRMKRYPSNLSLIMIDVDDFKIYNDTYGHLEGDALLKEISRVLQTESRVVDIVCRYAGDEFAIILPETNIEQAHIAAKKIHAALPHIKYKRPVTLSIGVAEFCKKRCSDRRDLIMKADQALYNAKKEGKNKTCYLK